MAGEAAAQLETTGTTAATPIPVSRADRAAADKAAREAFMSEVPDEYFAKPAGDATPEPKPAAPAKPDPKPAAKPDADAGAGEAADDEPDVELDDLDDEDDDELAAKPDADGGSEDEDTKRRLGKVRRAEQRGREQLAAERRSWETEKQQVLAEWKPKIEAAQEFERLKARAKGDPLSVLQALGVGDDDLEEVSQILYGMSKAGQKDPKYKAAAMQLKQNRELREELRTANERIKAIEERTTQSAAEQESNAAALRYLSRVAKSATDETPLLKAELDARPDATRERLRRVALQLHQRDGEMPDPKKVARTYEQIRRKALERDRPLLDKLAGGAGATTTTAGKPAGKPGAAAATAGGKPTPAQLAAVAPTNGKSVLPDRKTMIENINKLERGQISLDD
jgi:hypothetical protein